MLFGGIGSLEAATTTTDSHSFQRKLRTYFQNFLGRFSNLVLLCVYVSDREEICENVLVHLSVCARRTDRYSGGGFPLNSLSDE